MAQRSASAFEPLFAFLTYALIRRVRCLYNTHVIARYVKSSHQNDPGRTVLEIFLALFAIRTLPQTRTRADNGEKHFVQFSEKEVDELVDEWTPEPHSLQRSNLILRPYNFTGLAGNETINVRAIDTLRKYGVGSCGPPGFYGTIDVHMDLERDIAGFLGTEASILYSQGFSTIPCVISAFAKRGDIIVADRGVNFAIQKGLQFSHSTLRWFDHNDLKSLEDVLVSVEKDRRKRRGPLTRRFIITEGIFEKDGAMVDLPKLIELKHKYKYRLLLDEHLLWHSGFWAGSRIVVDHQRINGTSFVFSAAVPALLTVSASEGINILRNTPILSTLQQENVRAIRAVLDRVEDHDPLACRLADHPHPATSVSAKPSNPCAVRGTVVRYVGEERVLQDIVDEAVA
ncbi:serine palmitoyltransferase [Lactarius sanguifluus]|nr:serine palmitoyltransferase [Lactarius sanguifluus]